MIYVIIEHIIGENMKKSGLKIIIVFVIVVIIGIAVYFGTTKGVDNIFSFIFNNDTNPDKSKENDNYNGIYSYKEALSKQYYISSECRLSSLDIHNLVRGLNPFLGAYSFLNGKKIKFWKLWLPN